MKPNPGGILSGKAIIDRDHEINSIWKALQGRSVVLTSERRVGKTCVLRKMAENPEDGWVPVFYWVEGKNHPIEFIEGLYELVLEKEILTDKFHTVKKFYKKYAGDEQIGSWKLPQIKENWKTMLESAIKDISNADKKVLLMFDELPLMLSKFINSKECGPQMAIDFLDTLRGLRNKYEPAGKVKFVFCGSIGIHLVIKDLKQNHGYNSDPINNMKIIGLAGMSDDGAVLLCKKLTEGEDYQFDHENEVFEHICRKTDNLPFFIHHVFSYLLEQNKKQISNNTIDEAIEYLINDPNDEGFFNHYTDRIKTYYDENIKSLALQILDNASKMEGFWQEDEIINFINNHKEVDGEIIKETLKLLWNDHYFIRTTEAETRQYKFKYSIVQSWWKINRG
jgi:hypothetical protein